MAAAAASKHGKGDADSEDLAIKLTKDGLFGLLSDSSQPIGATLWDPHLSKDWDMEKPSKECISRIKRCAARIFEPVAVAYSHNDTSPTPRKTLRPTFQLSNLAG